MKVVQVALVSCMSLWLAFASEQGHDPIEVIMASEQGRVLSRDPSSKNFKTYRLNQCPKPVEKHRSQEDRYCDGPMLENAKPACRCKEVCHIWGDPHVSPFFSQCSEVAMHKPGFYTLYEVPPGKDRKPIRIEGYVSKHKNAKGIASGFKFVTSVHVSHDDAADEYEECSAQVPERTSVFDTSMCKSYEENKVNPVAMTATYQVFKDSASSKTIDVILDAKCAYRTETQVYINVTITLDDTVTAADEETIQSTLGLINRASRNRSALEMPDSSVAFGDDFGICTDPLRFSKPNSCNYPDADVTAYTKGKGKGKTPFWMADEKCKRPSGLSDGLECSCKNSCSAYGDPHVFPFNAKMGSNLDFNADVQDPQFRVMYSVSPYFSIVSQVDHCAFILGIWLVAAKLDNNGRPITSGSVDDKYIIRHYRAEDVCDSEESVASATRKRLSIPEMSDSELYHEAFGGLNAGQYLVNGQFETRVVPRTFENNIAAYQEQNPFPGVQSVITMGSVQAILKCHITRPHRLAVPKQSGTKYFNVCLKHENILVETPEKNDADDASVLAGSPLSIVLRQDPHVKYLMDVERVLKTDGFCATGDILNKKKRIFTFRNQGETVKFPFNPEVQNEQA